MIISVVGCALFLIVPKSSYLRGGIHFRNIYRNNTLELWWTIIPIGLIVVMGYPSFVLLYAIGINDKPKFITVKVTGRQWYWRYEYLIHVPRLVNLAAELNIFNEFGRLDAAKGKSSALEEGLRFESICD